MQLCCADNGNIAAMSNCVVGNMEKRVEVDAKCVAKMKEADELEMIGKRVHSLDVAFKVYNEYAFHKGFSIRCDKLRKREGLQEVRPKEFCCSKQDVKRCLGKKIKHLQNGAADQIVKVGLFFTLKLMGNGFVGSMT